MKNLFVAKTFFKRSNQRQDKELNILLTQKKTLRKVNCETPESTDMKLFLTF